MLKNIVYEDKDIIVVFKPAGIATQTARVGQQDMVSELKNYLFQGPEYSGRGEPYLGVVHRLDQPVSGLLVFAKSKQAAAGLGRQVNDGGMQKYYYAVVYGRPAKAQERLEDYLFKEAKTNKSLIVDENTQGAKKAVLNYKLVKTLAALEENTEYEAEASLVEVELLTGRHHQIRVQLSGRGMPILGDGKYGSEASRELGQRAGCKSVALCAYKLIFCHPITKKRLTFERQPEEKIFLPFFTRKI
ncbi:MAG: RluA family pseudouridine synthase [Clostridium sp.]|nr:RluA family pseudouridine synthase [Clostridium sp.]